jgi:hypothetical protein
MNLLKRTFSDVYGQGYSITTYAGQKYTQTININENNVYVHDCVFSYCLSSTNGAALNCSSNVYKLLVERTTFVSCKTSNGAGGGIYFYSTTSGESVLNKICGFSCSSPNNGLFAMIRTKSDVNNKNHFNDSSITHTSALNSNYPLSLYNGNILCPSINVTNNECKSYPAYGCYPTVSSASDTCCVSYSSIVNNTANGGWGCINHGGSGSSQVIDKCNIINNKQTSSSSYEIIFHVTSSLLIKDSCVLGNNKGMKLFYVISQGKVTISNCSIDDDIFTNNRFTGTVLVSKTIEKTFIHALSHISTQKCDSYFDSYGTLTGKPNVPSQSTKVSSRYLISCDNKKPTTDPFRITGFMFLIAMLHSDPSNDYYFDSNCYLQLAFVNN